MKRKKWTEPEELILISHYSYLDTTNTLSKLKTREKKFKPIADHINTVHHNTDPITYPFKWTWRDVSVKVQNMRNQYVGVKMKVRGESGVVDWDDGLCHWGNFLLYRDVFGDVEIERLGKNGENNENFGFRVNGVDGIGELELGFAVEEMEEGEEEGENGYSGSVRAKRMKRGGLGFMGSEGLALRENGDSGMVRMKRMKRGRLGFVGSTHDLEVRGNVMRRRDREEEGLVEEEARRDRGYGEEGFERKEIGIEKLRVMWARRELVRRAQEGIEIVEERRRRMRNEERRDEEEMELRERLMGMQIDHEKQMMQMYANACQNQMQALGVVARLMCQFLGSGGDGLVAGLDALTPQVLHSLQHQCGLGDNEKPDSSSPSEFL